MIQLKISDITLNRKQANEYSFDLNGYNGLLSELDDVKGDMTVLIDYTLYHKSGIASLGMVGATMVKTSSFFELESRILEAMRTTHKNSRGNKNKESKICLFRVI